MAKRIFKYKLELIDRQILSLPLYSKILSVESQNGDIILYALIDDLPLGHENFNIIIHGTGHDATDVADYEFLGTVKLHARSLMLHVFYDRRGV